MSGKRKGGNGSADDIGREIRAELRSIIRQAIDLRKPIEEFELDPEIPEGLTRFYVRFNRNRPMRITGLRHGADLLRLPDERIQDAALGFAKSVWHLKDRLKKWVRVTGGADDIETFVRGSHNLCICGDLANRKKHGGSDNLSRLDPEIESVAFDTSKSGWLELYYNGATKEKELLVSEPVPIPFTVEMAAPSGQARPDAVAVIHDGFRHWLPLMQRLGVLAGSDRESEVLRSTLYPDDPATLEYDAPEK